MSKGAIDIIKGKFLIQDGAFKNWSFILFCAVLALVMIASSHSADRKVYQIAELKTEMKALRSEFVDTKKDVMQLKMESNVTKIMIKRGIKLSEEPPYEITVKSDSE
ncbi:FtsL-like putative cell division protein [Flavobacteriaceae bacterium 14752]|uniref:FtsL-like putative cell division protein n=1 Tax=Mesohalobacter salilacus TaxID=2491711 RepID=UPI000F6410D6|nr:S-adenosyl-methyltransferase [Flavobacteriaceae bacterium 14752]